jgi:hypothetical protein
MSGADQGADSATLIGTDARVAQACVSRTRDPRPFALSFLLSLRPLLRPSLQPFRPSDPPRPLRLHNVPGSGRSVYFNLFPKLPEHLCRRFEAVQKADEEGHAAHNLAAQIESCDSPNAVLTVLQNQVQTFDPSPSANERWTTLLGSDHHCVVHILRVPQQHCRAGKSGDIKLETYALTCVITGIPTRSCDFYWHWSPTPSEYLP